MTRSDSGDPNRDQGNPFDLGLPMVRMPARKQKRRRPGRRGARRRRPPEIDVDALPPPDGPSYQSGDWEQWLDPTVAPQREPAAEPIPPDRIGPGIDEGDTAERDKSGLIPELIDRSGGNPGMRLRHPRRRRPDNRRADKLVAVLIMLGLGVVIVSIVLTVIHTTRDRTPAATAKPTPVQGVPARTTAPPASTTQPATFATDGCEQRRTADIISGTDPGGTGNGPDAILAFERAYYVQRSGFAARAVVADTADVPAAEQIQRGINQVPVGTRYCVHITRSGGEGQWEVKLTQQLPDEPPKSFTQIVTTRTISNRTLITAIHGG
ncbi:hypothetical protein [Nocardia mexicana]|uniref:DUF8176 domain-containing protein n=1 Tax=Nocardia mexicana TaxID=279262 RepID=A0A370H5P3_9NOCA|nr:hypothetical protein [Nocardia mexicana]RDI51727.1 hypothetical protein DFR68_104211 [Nocardia mexicana]